jgi:hypothetical protein
MHRTEIVAHRATKRAAEAYIARFADELGDTVSWDGSKNVPIHLAWHVEPAAQGGFDVVSVATPREGGAS